MDFSNLTANFIPIVVLACMILGYIIKNASFLQWVPNDDIPGILAVAGAIINVIVSGSSTESIVYGALMGLASTGLHQAFKKWLKNINVK